MQLRLTRPTTVAAALTPFKQALADLQYVLAAKQKACEVADGAIDGANKARDTTVAAAQAKRDAAVSAQTKIKEASEAEIKEANAVIGKLGKLLDPNDDQE